MFNRAAKAEYRCFSKLNRFWGNGRSLGLGPNHTLPEQVDAPIVRDAEQPRLQRTAVVELVEFAISLKQGLLHHVFPIHDGTCHSRTIAVQARTKMRDGFEKRQVACFKR